jgi:peptide-methionine (S)-S-oxide reductase
MKKKLWLGGSLLMLAPLLTAAAFSGQTQIATFAGGCFWSMEKTFDAVPGVLTTTSGYTGGKEPNPTYEQVSAGETGHAESVEVTYDPAKVSYAQLLNVYFHNIDPTTEDRAFCDPGHQYRSVIFTHDAKQMRQAQAYKKSLEDSHIFPQIVTTIEPAGPFYAAEEYHQDYHDKNPAAYAAYRLGCRRDARLAYLWGNKGK